MRLLHVVQRYSPYRGGSEGVFAELSERLTADGHQVTVYTTDAWDLEHFWSPGHRRIEAATEVINGTPVVRWPVRHLPVGALTYPVMRRLMTHLSDLPTPGRAALLEWAGRFSPWTPDLARRLRRDEPTDRFDLVHACNVTFESLIIAARDFARRAGIPFVVTPFVHLGEPDDRRVRKYYSMVHQIRLLQQADAVIAMTSLERDFLVARGVDAARVTVVGAGVDVAALRGGDGAAFRARHGLGETPLVFFVGTNAFDKGAVHLVEAVRRLWAKGRRVELALAGARMSHFDRFLEGLPRAERDRLLILGPISDAERRDLYAAGDVFAMPSRTDSFGVVFLEAWACGKPVVGARAGGVPDVVRDGVDGLLPPFGDAPAIADAIARLLDDPDAARAMGEAGRSTLPTRGWEVVTARVREIYRQAIERRKPSAGGRPVSSPS